MTPTNTPAPRGGTTEGLAIAPDWVSDCGTCRMYLGDCLEVLPRLGMQFDAVITSPKYNLGNTTGGGFPSLGHYDPAGGYYVGRGGGKWRKASEAHGIGHGYSSDDDDNMPHAEYVEWQQEFLRTCWANLSDDGAIFYNHKPRVLGGRLVTPLEYIPPELPIRQNIIWARAGGINFSPAFYLPTHEWVVIVARDAFRLKSKGASGIGDVWYIPQETGTEHPAPFPLKLPCNILETTTAQIICDPHAGSGTVGVACIRHGRTFIGIEKERRWFDLAVHRIGTELSAPRMFPETTTQRRMFEEDSE
jgi:site-specific DNA-methyltransferase (adenine-specific)